MLETTHYEKSLAYTRSPCFSRYRPRPRGHAVLRLARTGYANVSECLETHGISSKDADFSSNTVTVSKRFRCRRGCPWRGNFRGLPAEDGARRTVGMLSRRALALRIIFFSKQVQKTCQFWLLTFWLLTFWLLTVPSPSIWCQKVSFSTPCSIFYPLSVLFEVLRFERR